VKWVSQRKARGVNHHHPLRALARLGFADSRARFFAGAKLPSGNPSLHFNCCCSFNSPRNARQIPSETSCASQPTSRRQQVEGDGNSSGKSCQRAPPPWLCAAHRACKRAEAFLGVVSDVGQG